MITAAEAMENAIMYARDGIDLERARIWLDIARELREEHFARKSWQAVAPAAPTEVPEPVADTRTLQQVRADRTEVLRMPVERPGDPIAAEATCAHCGYFIKAVEVAPRTNDDMVTKTYVHTRTGIARCPVRTPAVDETFVYTYAEPESGVRS